MLPSEKAALKTAEKSKIEAERKEQADHLRVILNGTFKTPDGILTLKWLNAQCQFGKPLQILDERSLMLSAMRHNLYVEIRRHLTNDIIQKVEQ